MTLKCLNCNNSIIFVTGHGWAHMGNRHPKACEEPEPDDGILASWDFQEGQEGKLGHTHWFSDISEMWEFW